MVLKELIHSKIYDFQGNKIMFDFDLAELYDVETRTLKQAVRRNISRFPNDFLILLSKAEWRKLITSCDKLPETVKYSPAPPFAFTEQGVAMLASVLKSEKAILVSGKTSSTRNKDLVERESFGDSRFGDAIFSDFFGVHDNLIW